MSASPTHHYLNFTRKERRGVVLLISFILLLCAIPFLYPVIFIDKAMGYAHFDTSLASLQSKQATKKSTFSQKFDGDEKRPYDQPTSTFRSSGKFFKGELFSFDPNTISAEGWKKLGVRDKTIATILNYRNKGGTFKQPEDIKKIWGLFPDEAERLMPYVNIEASSSAPTARNYSNDFSEPKKYENRKTYSPVDINNSDTSAWIALPGIGSKLSQRIINFREKLGGFYDVNQVGETFGLPDSTFQKIKPLLQLSGEVRKLNINTATADEIKAHPYIRYQLGNAIYQYRVQHGAFKQVTDIKKIMIVDEATYQKLFPYLSVD